VTISTETRKAGPYSCNGSQTVFSFAFRVFTSSEVVVTLADSTGVETTLTPSTHYTVSLNSDQDADPGGTITTTGASSPYASGNTLTLTSDVALTQATDLPSGGPWSAVVVERALDKLTVLVQQVFGYISRGLRQPVSDAATIGELPTKTNRASMFLAFDADGDPIAADSVTGVPVTAYMATVLDDTTAAAARTTLDAARLVASLTEDTAPDKIADFFGSYDASASAEKRLRIITAIARAMPFGQGLLINGKIVTSVASNALTIAVKGDNDSDPSSTNPVYALFRKSTLTDSGFDIVPITGALSVVVSSGSTLGHRSGAACSLFVYLINNSGTAELAVSSVAPDHATLFGGTRLVSTTAEGGAGAADSAVVVYSTTARSNVPWTCVAMIYTTQATAGTWASAMTQVDQAPFTIPKYGFRVYRSSNQLAVANTTWTKFSANTEDFDLGGAYDLATDNRYECVVGGLHTFHFQTRAENPIAGMQNFVAIYVNGAQYSSAGVVFDGTTAGQTVRTEHEIYLNTGDYVEAYLYQSRGTTEDFTGGSVISYFDGVRH